jgi:hypothetical protein
VYIYCGSRAVSSMQIFARRKVVALTSAEVLRQAEVSAEEFTSAL